MFMYMCNPFIGHKPARARNTQNIFTCKKICLQRQLQHHQHKYRQRLDTAGILGCRADMLCTLAIVGIKGIALVLVIWPSDDSWEVLCFAGELLFSHLD